MGTKTVSKSEFKARALHYLREVEETRAPLVITDRGTPVVRVVPCEAPGTDARATLRGTVLKYDDPTEPVGLDDWDALR